VVLASFGAWVAIASASPPLRYEPGPFQLELAPEWVGDEPLEQALEPIFARRALRGREIDLWVHVGDERTPMTVWVGLDRSVRVMPGDAPGGCVACESATAATLSGEYQLGVSAEAETPWTEADLGLVAEAMDALSPALRRPLRGLEVRRERRGPPRMVARYEPDRSPPRVVVFERALAADEWSFVGAPTCPRPSTLLSVLHELAHAIADAPRRDLVATWEASADRVGLTAAVTSLTKRGPVVDAYAQVVSRRERAVTDYARRDVHEAFAEAFALYYADPEALRRVSPAQYAWFAAGGPANALADWSTLMDLTPSSL